MMKAFTQSLTKENLELRREANMFSPSYDKKDRKISGYKAPLPPALDVSPPTVYCSQYMQTKEPANKPTAPTSTHTGYNSSFSSFFFLLVPGNLRVRDNDLFNLFFSFPPPFPHSSKRLLV